MKSRQGEEKIGGQKTVKNRITYNRSSSWIVAQLYVITRLPRLKVILIDVICRRVQLLLLAIHATAVFEVVCCWSAHPGSNIPIGGKGRRSWLTGSWRVCIGGICVGRISIWRIWIGRNRPRQDSGRTIIVVRQVDMTWCVMWMTYNRKRPITDWGICILRWLNENWREN